MLKELTFEAAQHLVDMLGITNVIVRKAKVSKNRSAIIINRRLVISHKVYNLSHTRNVAILDTNIQNFIAAYLGNEYILKCNIKQNILKLFEVTYPNHKIKYLGIKKKCFVAIIHNDMYYAVNLINNEILTIHTKKPELNTKQITLSHDIIDNIRSDLFSLGELVPIN